MVVRAPGAGASLRVSPFRICHDSFLNSDFDVVPTPCLFRQLWGFTDPVLLTRTKFRYLQARLLVAELIAKFPECVPPRVRLRASTTAGALIQVLPATPAQSLAIFAAKQLQWERQK